MVQNDGFFQITYRKQLLETSRLSNNSVQAIEDPSYEFCSDEQVQNALAIIPSQNRALIRADPPKKVFRCLECKQLTRLGCLYCHDCGKVVKYNLKERDEAVQDGPMPPIG